MHERIMRPLLSLLQRPVLWAFAFSLTLLPLSALAQSAPKAYIPNSSAGTVTVINTSTGSVCTSATCVSTATYPISVGSSPQGVAVLPDGKKAYVSNTSSGSVSVIDTSTDSVVATVSLGTSTPQNIVVLPNGSAVYVADTGGFKVRAIDTSTNTLTATVTLSTLPIRGIAATNKTVYVTVGGLSCIDGVASPVQLVAISTADNSTTSNTFSSTLCNAVPGDSLAVARDGSKVYANSVNGLEIISAPGATLLSTVSLSGVGGTGNTATGVMLSPDGSNLFVTGSNGTISQVVGATLTFTATVGTNPQGMAITPDSSKIYVANFGSGTVSELTFGSGGFSLLSTVTVANSQFWIGSFMQQPPSISGKELGSKTEDCNAANAAGTLTCTGAVSAGEPIDVASGNMSYHTTDYTTAGQNPLAFTRYYNSKASTFGTFSGVLGGSWRNSFERFIQIFASSQVTVERADGQQITFNLIGSTWTPDSDVDITLTHSGSTWTLTDHNDTVETYTTLGSNLALLNSITSRNGYTQTLTYSPALTSVSDSYGRSLTLTYNTSGTLNTVTTPDSTTITFGYDTAGGLSRLTSVTYSTSPATSQTYGYSSTSPFALTSITDENGNIYNSWTYDASRRGLTSQQGSGANLTTLVYNLGSTTVTNPLGVTDTYTFTTLQGVPKITQISRAATGTTAAASETITYDSGGYVASLTDWNGNQTTYTNNAHGLPTTINEAVGSSVARTTTIAYNSTFVHLPDSITTPGVTTNFTYDGSGNALTRKLTDTTTTSTPYSTNGQTRTWTFTYDTTGHVLTSKTPNTNTTTLAYASDGGLTSITDALTHVTNITSHTVGGRPLTIVDPNGATNGTTTTLTYDARQRLLSKAVATASSGTHTTTYTLDATGNLTKLTLPDSSYISYVYDTAHRVTKATSALSEYQTYTLDALGDTTQAKTYDSSNNLWRQQTRTFDALGRITNYTGGVGTNGQNTTSYTYDANGNQLTIKDGNNHTTTRVFDALNRLKQSTDANSGVTQMAYDAHDRTTTVTDANSHATSYVYDGFGDAIQQVSPDTGTTVYHFDADANLTSKVDALSITTNYAYDALDRLTSRTGTGVLAANFGYDANGGYPLDNSETGRLSWVGDATGYLYFGHDAFGNVNHREKKTTGGTLIAFGN